MSTVTNEIATEREAQKAKWGTNQDDQWTPGEWSALIAHYATRNAVGDLRTLDLPALRASLVKTAALCVAAVESFDRRGVK